MRIDKRDELIASIYDAALGALSWDHALVALAEVTNCQQTSLEIHDPGAGVVERRTPLCAPEYQASYRAYWGTQVSLYRRTGGFPVGRVFSSAEIFDLDSYRRSAFYNEWWRPQRTGGETLLANIAADVRATVVLAAYKPFARASFTGPERRLFAQAVQHFTRAIEIHRRLRLAEVRHLPTAGTNVTEAVAVVDHQGRILVADELARQRLYSAGLLLRSTEDRAAVDRASPCLQSLRSGVAGRSKIRGRDGTLLSVSSMPVRSPVGQAWLAIDRPAALLCVSAAEDTASHRAERLMCEHSLTAAEAAVALEVAKGDGRAAVATRLGIQVTTVRSHLSAIFDKTGVRRQAELVRLVERT